MDYFHNDEKGGVEGVDQDHKTGSIDEIREGKDVLEGIILVEAQEETEEIVSSIYEEHKLLEAIGKSTGKLLTLNRELIDLTK